MASLSTPCHQLSNWSTTRVNSKGPGDSDRGRRWWRSTLTLAKAASRWSFQAPAHCIEVQLQCQRQLLSGLWGTWLEIWCRLLGTSCPIQIIDGLHFFIDVVNCWQCPCQKHNNGSMTSQWHCQWHCESNLKIQSDRFSETCQWHWQCHCDLRCGMVDRGLLFAQPLACTLW